MIVLWLACGLLAVGFCIVLGKFFLLKKDIRQLGRKLDDITTMDTNTHLGTNTFDADIVALAESINKMLEKSRQDYRETRRIETDLKRAIANISHDLRTPLTSAKGYLQMAQSDKLDDETLRYLAIVRGRLDALTTLMDSLFAFSRAIDENVTLSRVNIGNILRDALSENFAELSGNGFVVESAIPDAPVYCFCAEDALKRVLMNLITNATVHGMKYLRVSLSREGQIEIANKADGLNLIDTDEIFERFYTADAARTNKRTGLGLAIAKELVEKMDGSISATIDDDMLVVCVRLSLA